MDLGKHTIAEIKASEDEFLGHVDALENALALGALQGVPEDQVLAPPERKRKPEDESEEDQKPAAHKKPKPPKPFEPTFAFRACTFKAKNITQKLPHGYDVSPQPFYCPVLC